ncbi:PAS domain S-box protein [Streptomyces sp. NPDC005125]
MPGAAIAVVDAEGAVVGWTQAAERLVGYSAAEVVGRPAADMLSAAGDAAKASAFAERCRATSFPLASPSWDRFRTPPTACGATSTPHGWRRSTNTERTP